MTSRRGFMAGAGAVLASLIGLPKTAQAKQFLPFKWTEGAYPTVGDLLGDAVVSRVAKMEDRPRIRYELAFCNHPWPKGTLESAFSVSLFAGRNGPPKPEQVLRQIHYQALKANQRADEMCGWAPRKELGITPSDYIVGHPPEWDAR